MSSSTALLPKDRKDDHPIFLRVCHSPWSNLSQKVLCGLRGLTAAYLIVVFGMIVDYEINHVQHGYLAFFEFANISFFLLALYHLTAFIWTFMHLHHPHLERHEDSFATRIYKLLSPPRQNPTTKNRTWFSIYYMAVNTFPWVVAAIYWGFLLPMKKSPIDPSTLQKHKLPHNPYTPQTPHSHLNSSLPIPDTIPFEDMFNYGWFPPFIIFNRYIIAPLITLVEILFFSSIKRSTPIAAHITGLIFLVACYIGWVYVGYVTLGKYAFYFFDPLIVGWKSAIGAWVAFGATEIFFFWVIYFIIVTREMFSKNNERKGVAGYQQIPQ